MSFNMRSGVTVAPLSGRRLLLLVALSMVLSLFVVPEAQVSLAMDNPLVSNATGGGGRRRAFIPLALRAVSLTRTQRTFAFVTGSDGHLYVNWWTGSQWTWADQGAPLNTRVFDTPGVVTYISQ